MRKDASLLLILAAIITIVPFITVITAEADGFLLLPQSQSNIYPTVSTTPLAEPPPSSSEQTSAESSSSTDSTSQTSSVPVENIHDDSYTFGRDYFKILDISTGEINEVPILDYVRGAIAAEMPVTFHSEALISQGVSALTYAVFNAEQQELNPSTSLGGADFSADPSNMKGYMTEAQANAFYEINTEYNWDKICSAADEAIKYIMLHDDTPVAAAYHAISAGTTESAENVWGAHVPALLSVDSSYDILASDYQTMVQFTEEELRTLLESHNITLLPNTDTWFEIERRSSADYVTEVRVGDTPLTGNELRDILGLRSSNFEITRQGSDFLFTVLGYGHGVGLSQTGADYLARQGKTSDFILTHYYSGIELVPFYY